VLWGDDLPVEEVARHAGTIPYELLCAVSQRVPLELR
jgi:alanine racemase